MSKKAVVGSAICVFSMTSMLVFSQTSLAKPYVVSNIEKPISKQCRTVMNGKRAHFAGGASNKNGCTCLAKHAVSEIPPAQLAAFTDIMSERLKIVNKSVQLNREDADQRAQLLTEAQAVFTNIKDTQKISNSEFENLMHKTSKYLKTCGQRSSHNGANMRTIKSMTPYKKGGHIESGSHPIPYLRPAYRVSSQEDYKKLLAQLR